MSRMCPECQGTMRVQIVDGVQLDICPACHGTWFEASELRGMLDQSQTAIHDLGEIVPPTGQRHIGVSALLCPDDQVRLEEHHYLYSSPAIMHACHKCGGFFIAADQLPVMEQAHMTAHQASGKAAEAMAIFEGQHEAEMMRLCGLQILCRTMSQFSPGWFI